MKKIKWFLLMTLVGIFYMLGWNLDPHQPPSLYTYICNTKWLTDTITLFFHTDGTLSIISDTRVEYYYSIKNDKLIITDRYNNKTVYTLKIVSVTSTRLVLEGKWLYPLIYDKCIK